MSIFPPSGKGGVPPSQALNAYTPTHTVIGGEGPLYIDKHCQTFLTDVNFNSIISEILAAIDCLGPYNASRIDNLGRLLCEKFDNIDGNWVKRIGDSMTGQLQLLAGMPVQPVDAANKAYVDQEFANMIATMLAANALLQAAIDGKVSKAGDTMTGPLFLNPLIPTVPTMAATKEYVDRLVGGLGIFGDAPDDNFAYGRRNNLWWRVLALSGGTMTGPLLAFRDPVEDMEVVTKRWFLANVGGGGGTVSAAPGAIVGCEWQGGNIVAVKIWPSDPITPPNQADINALTFNVSPGWCDADDGSGVITLPGQIDVTFSSVLDTGILPVSTTGVWYYCFAIDTDDFDAPRLLLSLSPTNPDMPSGYTKKRRLFCVYRINRTWTQYSSTQMRYEYGFRAMTQRGDTFLYDPPRQVLGLAALWNMSDARITNLTSVGQFVTLQVPPVPIEAMLSVHLQATFYSGASTYAGIAVLSPLQPTQTAFSYDWPAGDIAQMNFGPGFQNISGAQNYHPLNSIPARVLTDDSRVRFVGDYYGGGSHTLTVYARGWIDKRGKE